MYNMNLILHPLSWSTAGAPACCTYILIYLYIFVSVYINCTTEKTHAGPLEPVKSIVFQT